MADPEILLTQGHLNIIDGTMDGIILAGYSLDVEGNTFIEPENTRNAFFEEFVAQRIATPETDDIHVVVDAYISCVQNLAEVGLSAVEATLAEHQAEPNIYLVAKHVGGRVVAHEAMQGTMNMAQWFDIQNGNPQSRNLAHLLRHGKNVRNLFDDQFDIARFGDDFSPIESAKGGTPAEVMSAAVNQALVAEMAGWHATASKFRG